MVDSMLGVDPAQSYRKNTIKKALSKIFIDFAKKKPIKNWFFSIILIIIC